MIYLGILMIVVFLLRCLKHPTVVSFHFLRLTLVLLEVVIIIILSLKNFL